MGDDQSSAPQSTPTQPQAMAQVILAKTIVPGDIVWIRMPVSHTVGSEQQKQRPWLVVSTKRFHQGPLGLVIGVPLSSNTALLSVSVVSRIRVDKGDVTYLDKALPDQFKLDRIGRTALCDQVRTLSEQRILARAGQAHNRVVDSARAGIAFNLDI